jgi:hypothetical protein
MSIYFYLGLLAVLIAIFPVIVISFGSKREARLQRMRNEEERNRMIDRLS